MTVVNTRRDQKTGSRSTGIMERIIQSHSDIKSNNTKQINMKRFVLIALGAITLVTSCRKIEVDDNGDNNNNGGTTDDLVLSGKINTDKTLVTGKTYKMKGTVYLVDGAKLTIQPGVTIQGEKTSRGALVVTRGTQI